MITTNPYLNFDGQTEEAFNFYKSVFGGEFDAVQKYGELPKDEGYEPDPRDEDRILHISLKLSEGNYLMGSDTPRIMLENYKVGTNYHIALSIDDQKEAERVFNELSDGGVVAMPLQKTFWGSLFGTFSDKFGVNWMVDCALPQDESK